MRALTTYKVLFLLLVCTQSFASAQEGFAFENATSFSETDDLLFNETTNELEDMNVTLDDEAIAPTGTPTLSPEEIAVVVPIVGQIPLKLMNTPGLLVGANEAIFTSATLQFLKENLDNEKLLIDQAGLLRQLRRPESGRGAQTGLALAPLYVELQVFAELTLHEADERVDLDSALLSVFEEFTSNYIATLQDEDEERFFQNLIQIEIVRVEEDTTPEPTVSPTPLFDPTLDKFTAADEGDPISVAVIVGIAVAAVIIIILIFLISNRLFTGKRAGNGGGLTVRKNIDKYSAMTSAVNSFESVQRKPRIGNAAAHPESSQDDRNQESSKVVPLQEQASDLESQALYSYSKTDSDSVMGHSMTYTNSLVGADTMSYAYSLEPGIEPSVAGSQPGDSVHTRSIRPVPVEIPQITMTGQAQKTTAESVSIPQIYGTASDIELTGSELAMLPSNLRDSLDESDIVEQQPTRKVVAPARKLGLVIDTTVKGPVVHSINSDSALIGKVFPGDIIVAIDDIDTRAMSASAITAVMARTANKSRVLTILEPGKPTP